VIGELQDRLDEDELLVNWLPTSSMIMRPVRLSILCSARARVTGKWKRDGERLTGLAVHIGARLAGLAQPGEVLVSRTVKDLVAGSRIEFDDRYELKGVPGE
jgi:hypothetical protein